MQPVEADGNEIESDMPLTKDMGRGGNEYIENVSACHVQKPQSTIIDQKNANPLLSLSLSLYPSLPLLKT